MLPVDVPLPEVVRAELSRSTEPTLNWPDDKEFEAAWLSKPIYVRSRAPTEAPWFCELSKTNCTRLKMRVST